jgi:hypothetical protein
LILRAEHRLGIAQNHRWLGQKRKGPRLGRDGLMEINSLPATVVFDGHNDTLTDVFMRAG